MGEVWLARHLRLGSQVAVKLMRGVVALSDDGRARFEREARAIAMLSSPHAVQVLDCGVSSEGEPFVVMELLHGKDLARRIKDSGALSAAEARTVVDQLAAVLGRAHELGMVHRDVKPANVFLVEGGTGLFVKLLDFGLAKLRAPGAHALTSAGMSMGTPYYMSPEQFLDPGNVDHRADLWALSVLAYECLTARMPFSAESLPALSLAISSGRFRPLSESRRDLGPALDGFMARAFAPELSARFGSAAELARAFGAALDAGSTLSPQARPPLATAQVPVEPSKEPPRRRMLALAGLVATGLALASGGLLWWSRTRPSPTPASADETATKPPSLRRASIPELVARARKEAARDGHDGSQLTLFAVSFTGVMPDGTVAQDGRAKIYFGTPGYRCVYVTITSDELSRKVEKCAKGTLIELPQCSLADLRKKLAKTDDKSEGSFIFSAVGSKTPQWSYSLAGSGGFLPDDC